MKSPFKFLDPFKPQDRKAFFGRDDEIEQLYTMVNQNRLILVYGQSGTGKTSLVQCGLASKFEVVDWFQIFVRKGDNINQSLDNALRRALKDELFDTYPETIEELYAIYVRPIYLLFDQFEELFILGNKAEQQQFFQTIAEIYAAKLPCRIIFIMREEYLAHLYEFEKVIPNLLDRRLRVERMSYNNVGQVILKSCEAFNITLESPEENTAQIIDNLSAGSSGIHLPYLQVYLDTLYREDLKRDYPKGLPDTTYTPLTFTTKEIEETGKIDDVLEKFLVEQSQNLQYQMWLKYTAFPKDGVLQILDTFVTEEGTKRPISYTRKDEIIQLPENIMAILPKMESSVLSETLDALENLRLLRFTEDTIEISHDTLATLIDQRRTDEQRQLYEMKRRLQNNLREYQQTKEYLTRKQLNILEGYLDKLNLNKEEQEYIDGSYAAAEAKEKEEKERQERELKLAKDKLAANRRTTRTRFIFVMVILLMTVGGFGYYNYLAASNNEKLSNLVGQLEEEQEKLLVAQDSAKAATYRQFKETGQRHFSDGDFIEAINAYNQAKVYTEEEDALAELDELIKVSEEKSGGLGSYDAFMNAAKIDIINENYLSALRNLQEAKKLNITENKNAAVDTEINSVKGKLLPIYIKLVEEAYILQRADKCVYARRKMKEARRYQGYISQRDLQETTKSKVRIVEKKCGK